MSVTVQQSVVLFTDTKISDCRAVTLLLFSVTLLLLYQFHDIIASRKFQIIIQPPSSTTGIMEFAKKSEHKEFIIGTENSIVEHLQFECPDKKF